MIHQEIALLKELKEIKPWTGGYQTKKEKFEWLLNELCLMHKLETPKLIVPKNPKQFKWTQEYCGDCAYGSKYEGRIRIRNFSVIILLHEFKHWIDFHNPELKWQSKKDRDKRDYDAYYYSARRFYEVWPERIKMLSEFIENNIFETKSVQSKIRKMKNRYLATDTNFKLKAETCAVIDIVLGEVWC